MADSRPVVLVTEGSDRKPLDWLREHVEVVEIATSDPGFDAHANQVAESDASFFEIVRAPVADG